MEGVVIDDHFTHYNLSFLDILSLGIIVYSKINA